jgi:hypothetical protein
MTMVFEKNANYFAENCRKSQKILVITSTPPIFFAPARHPERANLECGAREAAGGRQARRHHQRQGVRHRSPDAGVQVHSTPGLPGG